MSLLRKRPQSDERVFEVELADGKLYRSVAPRQFCWNDQGRLVAENEPAAEASGMVAARVLDWTDDGQTIVEVPDGEVIAVDLGAARFAHTPEKLAEHMNAYLRDPTVDREGRRRFVELEVGVPIGRSSDRVVEVLRAIARGS